MTTVPAQSPSPSNPLASQPASLQKIRMNNRILSHIIRNSTLIPSQLRTQYLHQLSKYKRISTLLKVVATGYIYYVVMGRKRRWFRLTTNWWTFAGNLFGLVVLGNLNMRNQIRYAMGFYKENQAFFANNWLNIAEQMNIHATPNGVLKIIMNKDLQFGQMLMRQAASPISTSPTTSTTTSAPTNTDINTNMNNSSVVTPFNSLYHRDSKQYTNVYSNWAKESASNLGTQSTASSNGGS